MINKVLQDSSYDFLREDYIKDRIMLLTLGGSHAYGTNIETPNHVSDVDIRGIFSNTPREILTMKTTRDIIEDSKTDTVLYSINKIINLLANCNPNVIEMLGTREEDIAYLSETGKLLRDNSHLFLSQKAAHSFGGYAISQLRRLQNALARDSYPQPEKEVHILESIKRQMATFEGRYNEVTSDELKLYIDKSNKEDYETEIFINMNLNNFPLRDTKNMLSEMNNIIKDYSKLNHRNNKKDEVHLNKHAMHLIRLFLMGTEILEGKGINTYREHDRDLLLDIRNGKYTYEQIFEMVDELQEKFRYAEANSTLPKKPDMSAISDLVVEINSNVLLGNN